MKVDIIEEGQCQRLVQLELPPEKAEEQRLKTMADLRKKAVVPGFRPGHAPASLLARRFKAAIVQEVIEKLLPEAIHEVLAEHKLHPVGEPVLRESKYEFGGPIQAAIAFEIVPEVTLQEYRGLEVEFAPTPFSEEFVDQELNHLRERHADLRPVENRPIQLNDYAEVDFDATAEGLTEPIHQDNKFMMVAEETAHAPIALQLVGMTPGEIKEIDLDMPDTYLDKKLAGKRVHLRLKLNGFKEEVLPPLDDEFARNAGKHESLDDLRNHIRGEVEKAVEQMNRNGLERRVVDKMLEGYDFDIPSSMADALFKGKAESMIGNLMHHGLKEEQIGRMDWRKIREEQTPELVKSGREMLVLQKIAEKEGIEITDEMVEQELVRRSELAKVPLEQIKKSLVSNEEGLGQLKMDLTLHKVIQFLVSAAKISAPKAPPVETAAEEKPESKAVAEPPAE